MKMGRYVVDGHVHGSTLYRPAKEVAHEEVRAFPRIVEPYDNSEMMLYDMDCYGVDMGIILPSFAGTRNEMVAQMVKNHPTRFRGCCMATTLRLQCALGKAEWTIDAALAEVEAALKTGNFVGIGEFAPGGMGVVREPPTFRQRLDEFRAIAEVAHKYDVPFDFHEYGGGYWGGGPYAGYAALSKARQEYPDVKIVIKHAGISPGGRGGIDEELRHCCSLFTMGGDNLYMETGYMPAEYYEIPLKDPNIGATQLIWGGGDTGSSVWSKHMTQPGAKYRTPYAIGPQRHVVLPLPYQTDFYGWCTHQIHRLKDLNLATQDEINLIVGGNAAKIYKLPVPMDRMFMCGRADVSGIHWQHTIPYIPKDQIQPRDTK